MSRQLCHKFCAWCNAVTVKGVFLWHFCAFFYSLLPSHFSVQGCSKATSALLIHLCARGNAVYSHEKQLLGLDLAEEIFNIIEYGNEHFVFAQAKGSRVAVFVGTVVNNSIHIQLHHHGWHSYPIIRRGKIRT